MLRKRDKMRGLPSILSPFRNEINYFNKIRFYSSQYIKFLKNRISAVKTSIIAIF